MAQSPRIETSSASPEIESILHDAQRVLRVGDTPWLMRTLMQHPEFFRTAWGTIKPAITEFFESSADHVRSEAAALCQAKLKGANLKAKLEGQGLRDDVIREVSEVLLVHHYVSPKLLLIALALHEALAEEPASVESIVLRPTGRGVPPGMPQIRRVDRGNQSGKVKEILEEETKLQKLPTSTDLMLSLAIWPEALPAAWELLKGAIESDAYESVLAAVRKSASERLKHLRRRIDLGQEVLAITGVDEKERAEILGEVKQAITYYLSSVVSGAYFSLSLCGSETTFLNGEALLLRWATPRHG